MKKHLLILLLVLPGYYSHAQGFKIGVIGGYNYSGIDYPPTTLTVPDYTSSTASKPGFNLGVIAEYTIGHFSFQPGIAYTTKGGKFADRYLFRSPVPNEYIVDSSDVRINYLEVPLNAIYNVPLAFGKFFVGGGPYMAFCISAKNAAFSNDPNGHDVFGTYSISTHIEFGISGQLGVELKDRVIIKGSYEYGSTSITSYQNEPINTRVFSISLGYFICKRK